MFPKKLILLIANLMCFAAVSLYEVSAQSLYYVVIGGFRVENNAKKFTGYARTKFYDARYEFNHKYQLHYVYIQRTDQREAAIKQTIYLQQNSEFSDAWVYTGLLGDTTVIAAVPDKPFLEEPDTTSLAQELLAAAKADSSIVLAGADPEVDLDLDLDLSELRIGRVFKFLIQTLDGKVVPGNVHHVDLSRGRDIASFPAGRNITILPPTRANNPMTVVCGIFGYKEVIKQIDYLHPEITEGAAMDENGTWIINYPMERLSKGDVSVMYHVSFYKDAVVMLPQSKAELDELVSMMQANPNYKIKIHGHCNGNHERRIISLGKTKNYFDIRGSDEIKGSAKSLSRLRAEAVQMYLADHGIEKNRALIYGWGGKNMLVDENSASAKLNDRIEVEILSH